jgi:DNA invertase Pin-like site-specific DNA recombinase
MHNSDAESDHDLRLRPRFDRRARPHRPLAQLKAAGCEKVFRDKLTGATADRPQLRKLMSALSHGDEVVIPAVDRLSRDTTDLLVIAREMQRAGAGIRAMAKGML